MNKSKINLITKLRDKNWIFGKIFLVIGMIFMIISLVKYNQPYFWVYFLIGFSSAIYGAYLQEKSKKSKNPFEFNSFKDVIKVAVIMGAFIAIIMGIVRNQSLTEILSFGGFAIIFLFVLFSLYYKFKKKK